LELLRQNRKLRKRVERVQEAKSDEETENRVLKARLRRLLVSFPSDDEVTPVRSRLLATNDELTDENDYLNARVASLRGHFSDSSSD
jgi:cell division protein FtsB